MHFQSIDAQGDYSRHVLILADDDKAGCAVLPDGEIVSVFKVKGHQSRVASALMLGAAAHGGQYLTAFDCGLVEIYVRAGLRETNRAAFVDAFAPQGWPYGAFGRPDVVRMAIPASQAAT